MMVLDQAVEDRLIPRASDLLKVQGPKLAQRPVEGRGIHQHWGGLRAPRQRIGRSKANARQLDLPRPVQHQQQAPADHIARRTVGLLPLPSLAQFRGQRSSASSWVFGD
jgi:hypothetical protein